jgi:DNA-directed RNA polymerase specialized sigma24 family protein
MPRPRGKAPEFKVGVQEMGKRCRVQTGPGRFFSCPDSGFRRDATPGQMTINSKGGRISRVAGLGGIAAMSTGDSVSIWLGGLKAGRREDVERLWNRYFERLVRLAGSRLPGHARRAVDEEDIALSAFRSFCGRAEKGQFPDLADRDDLWRLLAAITARKVIGVIRHQTRQKRGGGHVLGESAFVGDDGDGGGGDGMAQLLAADPTPEDAAQFADDCDRLLERLGDDTLRRIALRKLEGYSSAEIAAELGTSARTVDRKLNLIRALWDREAP